MNGVPAATVDTFQVNELREQYRKLENLSRNPMIGDPIEIARAARSLNYSLERVRSMANARSNRNERSSRVLSDIEAIYSVSASLESEMQKAQ